MSKQRPLCEMPIEPERYEISEPPAYRFDFDRREFLQLVGGGVAVLVTISPALGKEATRARRWSSSGPLPEEVGAWLHIGEKGLVTIYTGKVEVGQDIRTSLAQAVADELGTTLDSIQLVMGDTDLTPYDRGTFGSRTTPVMAAHLRRASAAARAALIELAAKRWEVDPRTLVVADGRVYHSGKKTSVLFGDLTRGKKLLRTISDDDPVVPVQSWEIAGQSTPKVRGLEFVTGEHRFTSDMTLPGMLYGKVLRPSSLGATLASLDASEAGQMAGVQVIRDGEFVGVTAPSEERASRAIESIRAEWKSIPQPSSSELFDYLEANPSDERGWRGSTHETKGSLASGLTAADKTIEAAYRVAYIAHVPLEPRAALARWADGKLTVWTGTQRPFGVHAELVEVFRLRQDRVRVLVPDTGSGYGGKHTGEAAIEAARLAKAAGRPVKVVWSREEEFTWAYFRPAGVIEVKGGVTKDGRITAWEFHNYNSGSSSLGSLYEIPNQHVEYHPTRSPLRQGSYRGLASTANHFARESHIDDLAHAIGMDPLNFRVKNLKDERLLAVLEAATKRFRWEERPSGRDRGQGIAAGYEKGGYVVTCAEVSIHGPERRLKIERLVTAFECGAIVNPDNLKNQVEGCAIMGIGGALFEAITFADGKIRNPHLASYRVPRFSDVPVLEAVLVDRRDLPSAGAGETPIVCVAPAVGNAIFNATGIRLRSLPMIPDGLVRKES